MNLGHCGICFCCKLCNKIVYCRFCRFSSIVLHPNSLLENLGLGSFIDDVVVLNSGMT